MYTSGWAENPRGVSYTFGEDIIELFCEKHDIDLIVRAHQVVEDGYEFQCDRLLVTVFSAPNYCGEFDNAGAMMVVKEGLNCSFNVLRPASHRGRIVDQNGGQAEEDDYGGACVEGGGLSDASASEEEVEAKAGGAAADAEAEADADSAAEGRGMTMHEKYLAACAAHEASGPHRSLLVDPAQSRFADIHAAMAARRASNSAV